MCNLSRPETNYFSHRGTDHYLPWHGHITALSIAPQYRRLGYGKKLSNVLELECITQGAWFVDLFVRASNKNAIQMYESMGYSTYRTVVKYYSDDPTGVSAEGEDALDMRKPLPRDKDRKHIRENGAKFKVDPEDVF